MKDKNNDKKLSSIDPNLRGTEQVTADQQSELNKFKNNNVFNKRRRPLRILEGKTKVPETVQEDPINEDKYQESSIKQTDVEDNNNVSNRDKYSRVEAQDQKPDFLIQIEKMDSSNQDPTLDLPRGSQGNLPLKSSEALQPRRSQISNLSIRGVGEQDLLRKENPKDIFGSQNIIESEFDQNINSPTENREDSQLNGSEIQNKNMIRNSDKELAKDIINELLQNEKEESNKDEEQSPPPAQVVRKISEATIPRGSTNLKDLLQFGRKDSIEEKENEDGEIQQRGSQQQQQTQKHEQNEENLNQISTQNIQQEETQQNNQNPIKSLLQIEVENVDQVQDSFNASPKLLNMKRSHDGISPEELRLSLHQNDTIEQKIDMIKCIDKIIQEQIKEVAKEVIQSKQRQAKIVFDKVGSNFLENGIKDGVTNIVIEVITERLIDQRNAIEYLNGMKSRLGKQLKDEQKQAKLQRKIEKMNKRRLTVSSNLNSAENSQMDQNEFQQEQEEQERMLVENLMQTETKGQEQLAQQPMQEIKDEKQGQIDEKNGREKGQRKKKGKGVGNGQDEYDEEEEEVEEEVIVIELEEEKKEEKLYKVQQRNLNHVVSEQKLRIDTKNSERPSFNIIKKSVVQIDDNESLILSIQKPDISLNESRILMNESQPSNNPYILQEESANLQISSEDEDEGEQSITEVSVGYQIDQELEDENEANIYLSSEEELSSQYRDSRDGQMHLQNLSRANNYKSNSICSYKDYLKFGSGGQWNLKVPSAYRTYGVMNFEHHMNSKKLGTDESPFIHLTVNTQFIDVLCVNCYECVKFKDVNKHSMICSGLEKIQEHKFGLKTIGNEEEHFYIGPSALRQKVEEGEKLLQQQQQQYQNGQSPPIRNFNPYVSNEQMQGNSNEEERQSVKEQDIHQKLFKVIKAIRGRLIEVQLQDADYRNNALIEYHSNLHALAVKIFQNINNLEQVMIMRNIIDDFVIELTELHQGEQKINERIVSLIVFATRINYLAQEKCKILVQRIDEQQFEEIQLRVSLRASERQSNFRLNPFEKQTKYDGQLLMEIKSEVNTDKEYDSQSNISDISAVSNNQLPKQFQQQKQPYQQQQYSSNQQYQYGNSHEVNNLGGVGSISPFRGNNYQQAAEQQPQFQSPFQNKLVINNFGVDHFENDNNHIPYYTQTSHTPTNYNGELRSYEFKERDRQLNRNYSQSQLQQQQFETNYLGQRQGGNLNNNNNEYFRHNQNNFDQFWDGNNAANMHQQRVLNSRSSQSMNKYQQQQRRQDWMMQ